MSIITEKPDLSAANDQIPVARRADSSANKSGSASSSPVRLIPQHESAPELRPRHSGQWRMLWILAVLVGLAYLTWRVTLPTPVKAVHPEVRSLNETIAVSGLVGGNKETVIGAETPGIIAELYVDEGAFVHAGQRIALVRNEVAEAQERQAQQSLASARSQEVLARQKPQPSEIEAVRARVRMADSSVTEARGLVQRARTGVLQADAAVAESQAQANRASAVLKQARARHELARKTLERYRALLAEEVVPRQTVDQMEADFRTAEAEVESSTEAIQAADAHVQAAKAARTGAVQDALTAETKVMAAEENARSVSEELHTIEALPRPEGVRVASERTKEAGEALNVAGAQRRMAIVTAPFSGTITEIIAEKGSPAGTGGIVKLVQTPKPEIRLDVDENNLAALKIGQSALITSSAFPASRTNGRVSKIGARIDSQRGTVQVTVVPGNPPQWLRPGQTVNVNIVTAGNVRRLVLPNSTVRREADRTSVLVISNGRAQAREVTLGALEGPYLPVLSGIHENDLVILNADKVQPGSRVRELDRR